MDKSPDAFRTISEVATDLDLPQHVLRFWETRFVQIKPLKRGGGRRYYRPDDIDLLKGIRHLLYGEGYTIRGVQRILKEQGVRFVTEVWQEGAPQPPPAGGRWEAEPAADPVAAEEWSPEPETPEGALDEAASHWPVLEEAWIAPGAEGEGETGWRAPSTPTEEPVDADGPAQAISPTIDPAPSHTPFTIGRATPREPNTRSRDDAEPSTSDPRFEPTDDEDMRATQAIAQRFAPRQPAGEPTTRPRAERIAGFTTPPRAPNVVDPRMDPSGPAGAEVTPLRPGVEADGSPGLGASPAPTGIRSSRIPAGLRSTTAAPIEPQRGPIGHFIDRLRPTASHGHGADGAPPPSRAGQSLSRDEIRRLQSTLFELLECKRLLDQIR